MTYNVLSVNIEMGGGVMLGLPTIMHCSHPNINLCLLSFLRININKSTRYCLEVCKLHCMINKSGLFMSEYVRA